MLIVGSAGIVDLVSDDVFSMTYPGSHDHINAGQRGTGNAALFPVGAHVILSNTQETPTVVTIFAILPANQSTRPAQS